MFLTPYPKNGRALSGVKSFAENKKITIILTKIIGRVISVTLDIDLNPYRFKIVVITIKNKITISTSIFGKYIRTRLSANILMTKEEIIKRYIKTNMLNIFFILFPAAYSHISIMSQLGKRSKILLAM